MSITFSQPEMTLGGTISLHFAVDGPERQKIQADGQELFRSEVARALQSFVPDPTIDRQIAEAQAAVEQHGQHMEALNREAVERQQKRSANHVWQDESLNLIRRDLEAAAEKRAELQRQTAALHQRKTDDIGAVGAAVRVRMEARWAKLLTEFLAAGSRGAAEMLHELLAVQHTLWLSKNEPTILAMVRKHQRGEKGAAA